MSECDEMHRACRLGDVQLLCQIIQQHSHVLNILDTKLGWAPLYRTVICGHIDATKLLLTKGADPNVQNRMGETPLHQAAMHNNLKLAKILLRFKAYVNCSQYDGDTPLHHACSKGHVEIVRLLLKHKADTSLANNLYSKTPIHVAVESGHYKVVQALLCSGAPLNVKDKSDKIPLDYANSQNMIDLIAKCMSHSNSTEETYDEIFIEEAKTDESKIDLTVESPYALESISGVESCMEPECEKGNVGSPGLAQYRSFSFGVSTQRSPLYVWLELAGLESLFEILVNNGFDDLEQILNQMSTEMPLTLEILENIGISKVGHRIRLMARLDKELNRDRVLHSEVYSPVRGYSKNNISSLHIPLSLSDWLGSLNLKHLLCYFTFAGFSELDHLTSCMSSNYPISDSVLISVGIDKLGHRHRIIAKLREKTNKPQTTRKLLTIEMESEGKKTACELCSIM